MFPPEAQIWIDWHLTNRCNFFCDYCHPQIRHVLNKRHLDERTPKECAAAFDAIGPTCGILMSGGEPFAFPGFVDLCRLLTRKHFIAINTNLSFTEDIRCFAASVPPDRVSRILAAVHVEERERNDLPLEDFGRNFRILRDAGYDITAAYVLHPELLHRAESDFERLRSSGVDRLVGKVFKGIWQKRRFPRNYNDEELQVVRKLITDYHVGAAYIDRDWNFSGAACRAGTNSFKVMITGEVRRCVSVPGSLGNLFDGSFTRRSEPAPCTAKRILVLSECAEHLVERPVEFEALLGGARVGK
ncbi:radical SAM protein [Streptomyces sp. NPDC057540]|uniref:radical SAM protein n=1 Tax=Streptomyces sp. NPDC057540 TaxID=3346160 RepID=UPI00367B2B1A